MERDYTIKPAHPQQEARRLLGQFMERAYGRIIREEHFEIPMAAFHATATATGDFIEAMLAAYRAALSSPISSYLTLPQGGSSAARGGETRN